MLAAIVPMIKGLNSVFMITNGFSVIYILCPNELINMHISCCIVLALFTFIFSTNQKDIFAQSLGCSEFFVLLYVTIFSAS